MKNLEKYVESHDLRQLGSIFTGNSVETGAFRARELEKPILEKAE